MYLRLLCILFLLAGTTASAQLSMVEKTYELSKSARKGTLVKVDYQASDKTTSLVYVTKATLRKVAGEIYVFDKDFNFVRKDMFDEERERYRKRFKLEVRWPKWQLKFKDLEAFAVDGVEVMKNVSGGLVLLKAKYHYLYDAEADKYIFQRTEKLDKLKPRTEDDAKYSPFYYTFNPETSETIILCNIIVTAASTKGKSKEEIAALQKKADENFYVIVFDKELNLTAQQEIVVGPNATLAFHQLVPPAGAQVSGFSVRPRSGGDVEVVKDAGTGIIGGLVNNVKNVFVPKFEVPVMTDADGNYFDVDEGEWLMIFASAQGGVKEKGVGPHSKDYRYVRTNASGKLLQNFVMKNFNHQIVMGQYPFRLSGTYFTDGKKEYFFMNDQLTVIENQQVNTTAPTVEQMQTLTNNPRGMPEKAMFPNKGVGPVVSNNIGLIRRMGNNLFLAGQNGEVLEGLYYDSANKLKAVYKLAPGKDKGIKSGNYTAGFYTAQDLVTNASSTKAYWIMTETFEKTNFITGDTRAYFYPRIAKIDLATGQMTDFETMGVTEEKKEESYYLDMKFPFLTTEDAAVIFFGEDKKGKNIWFGRLNIQ